MYIFVFRKYEAKVRPAPWARNTAFANGRVQFANGRFGLL